MSFSSSRAIGGEKKTSQQRKQKKRSRRRISNLASHARNNTTNVQVLGVDTNLSVERSSRGFRIAVVGVGIDDAQVRIVDTREVAAARWLGIFRVEGEAVVVEESQGLGGVTLARVHRTPEDGRVLESTVVTVELDGSGEDGVIHDVRGRVVVAREIEPIVSMATRRFRTDILLRHEGRIALDDPEYLSDGVVEVETVAHGSDVAGTRLGALVLELLHEILVHLLGKHATLHGVEEDVGDEQLHVTHVARASERGGVVGLAQAHDELVGATGAELDLEVVELHGDERQGALGVLVPVELEGHIDVLGLLAKLDQFGFGVGLADLLAEATTGLRAGLFKELKSLTGVLIKGVASNLIAHAFNEGMANRVGVIGDIVHKAVILHIGVILDGIEPKVEIHAVAKITGTADGGGDGTTGDGMAVEIILHLSSDEHGVPADFGLPEGHIGIDGEVAVLRALGRQLSERSGNRHVGVKLDLESEMMWRFYDAVRGKSLSRLLRCMIVKNDRRQSARLRRETGRPRRIDIVP